MIDVRVGSAELDRLAEALATPCRIGEYTLEGLIRKTSTALVFVARGGAFGANGEGVIKLTGGQYASLLERELSLLVHSQQAETVGVVRPVLPQLVWLSIETLPDCQAACMLLPFLRGGDLVQLIGRQASRGGNLGPWLALKVGLHVGGILRALLQLPRPIVHRDVKPQNVLLPFPGSLLTELTLIDMDVSDELDFPISDLASAPCEVAVHLVDDVHGFGELLFALSTGAEPPVDGDAVPNPHTGNTIFDALVERCLTSAVDGPGYLCLADNALWHDLDSALAFETGRKSAGQWRHGPLRFVLNRRSLAGLGTLLFIGLMLAVASKFFVT